MYILWSIRAENRRKDMADGIKYCRKCGRPQNIDAKFCKYCGNQFANTSPAAAPGSQFCRNCGKEISADAKFCRYCGFQYGQTQSVRPESAASVYTAARQVRNAAQRQPQKQPSGKPAKKLPKLAVGLALAVAVIIFLSFLIPEILVKKPNGNKPVHRSTCIPMEGIPAP